MASLPIISARKAVRALERCGFRTVSVRGSHHKMIRPGDPGQKVIVPVHANRDLPRGTLASIIEQSGLSDEEFLRALR